MEKINRRTWLKNGALATGGFLTALPFIKEVKAMPALGMRSYMGQYYLQEEFEIADEPANIKARLLANENPYGPSKKAIAAIAESASRGNRYVYGSTLKMEEVLSKKEGVKAENILLAPGSTDILEKTAFALCTKGGNVISADPSYLSLVKTATAIGATWKNIPLKSDYSHDLAAMEKAIDSETKLI